MPEQEPAEQNKRRGGFLTEDDEWLVLTESVDRKREGWIHNCGVQVLSIIKISPVWYDDLRIAGGGGEVKSISIPFCPNCETKP